ncbi:MAG: hypothetical protein AAFV71_04980 [Cyanobacteria bacterium J06633_8]
MNPKKKFNYTKWGFIFGVPIAFSTLLATLTVQEIRCKLGLQSCAVQTKEIAIYTQTETGEALGGVKIQFTSQGAPEVKYTDDTGFARVKIPIKGDVNLNLTKRGFPTQNFNIDLDEEQSKSKIVRFQKSGIPEIKTISPTPTPTVATSPENTKSVPPIAIKKASTVWKQKCASATPGSSLRNMFRSKNDSSVTFGKEVLPLFAYISGNNRSISGKTPLEFVCNLNSSYQQLNFVFGVHSANSYALPENNISFQVFLDSELAGNKQVVVGQKQEWKLNLQGVKNISLRAECTTNKCPALSFSEMSLQ